MDEVDGHADAQHGEEDREGYGGAGRLTGLPGSGGQLLYDDQVIDHGDDIDEDAEGDECYSGDDGVGGGDLGGDVLGVGELAEEEAEAADREAYTHEAEAGSDPGEERTLGGEVDAGILLGRVGHVGIVVRCVEGIGNRRSDRTADSQRE